MIDVVVNGEKKRIDGNTSVADFLVQVGLTSPAIAVEINQQIAPRDTHHQTFLQSGDIVEIVTLVGGG